MEQLKPLIQEMIKLVESGKDVVNGQLPDLCKQIVRLYLWGNVIEIPILIGMMVFGAYMARWVYRKAIADGWSEMPWIILWIPIAILECIIGSYAYGCGQTLLESILAPKLLILETLRKFL